MPNFISHQENVNENSTVIPLLSYRSAYNEKDTSRHVLAKGVPQQERCWVGVWAGQRLGSIHLKHSHALEPGILALSLYLTEMHSHAHQKTGTETCAAAFLVIVPNWKQLKKPSRVEWINCVYSSTGLRMNELLLLPTPWRILGMIWRKTQESTYLYKVQIMGKIET